MAYFTIHRVRSYQAELESTGLTSKEAAVYLAMLGLGPCSVQGIAQKTKVARGTVYVVLESLMEKGLAASYYRDSRRVFIARKPEYILNMLEKERAEIESTMTTIHELLPALQAITRTQEQKPVVRYYEGREGITAIRQEMVMYSQPRETWYSFSPTDALWRFFGEEDCSYTLRAKKGIFSRVIGFTTSSDLSQRLSHKAPQERIQRKFVVDSTHTTTCGVTLFRDRVAVGFFGEDAGGMIIESRPLAEMFTLFFRSLWKSL